MGGFHLLTAACQQGLGALVLAMFIARPAVLSAPVNLSQREYKPCRTHGSLAFIAHISVVARPPQSAYHPTLQGTNHIATFVTYQHHYYSFDHSCTDILYYIPEYWVG